MILQALTKLYEDLYAQGKVPPYGWGKTKIGYKVCIDENGELTDVVSLLNSVQIGKKTKLEPVIYTLPSEVVRSGKNYISNFLWDNAEYIFGISAKKEDGIVKFGKCKELHNEILSDVDNPIANAIKAFFEKWDISKAKEHPALANRIDDISKGSNLLFCVSGVFAYEDPEIAAAWDRYYKKDETGETDQCLATGKQDVIKATHLRIKGVNGAQPSGASIVSFNESAYCSYDKEQNFNAPIGGYAAFAYTTALNYLLADNENKHYISDTAVVCWADGAEPQYDKFSNSFLFGDPHPQQITTDELRTMVKSLANGLRCKELNLDPSRRFYILGLAPNAARLSVSFFYSGTFGELMKNVAQHHERLEITGRRFDIMPLWAMLKETVNQNSKDKTTSPTMSKSVARAIFTGTNYPASLIQATMLRIRAERKITAEKAAIFKAYYLKNGGEGCPKEVLTVSLNENSTNIPYTLGRLFAVYEAVQEAANPGINATIKDKYFNSAAATPGKVFPILDNLAAKHLRKLGSGMRKNFDKQISTLKNVMNETNPTRLTLSEQGSFYIGYYHQKEARFTKKEDK